MKIGILTEGDNLNSFVAEDFGRAPYFLIVDSDTFDYEVVENEFKDAAEGAGMLVADAISELGVDVIIVGGIGSHGYDRLTKAGITVSFDEEGVAEEAVKRVLRRLERMKKLR
ncbi:MAG TPA: hypothetical protein HA366_02815 [Candidatus Methanomethylophilaceae archaeon]|nr:hypothetical protein [Candidatus Methanomethylophilaceae archaeon]HIJ00447.1 hypothetical protein [Candidatus Methanomethylophilaceae archaeon]